LVKQVPAAVITGTNVLVSLFSISHVAAPVLLEDKVELHLHQTSTPTFPKPHPSEYSQLLPVMGVQVALLHTVPISHSVATPSLFEKLHLSPARIENGAIHLPPNLIL
jgi:hypothetical protein